MSLRHVSRPSDRDIRMHDPPPHIHPVHTNGVSASTPALPNGTVHVSPTVAPPNGPNGVMAPPTMIQKLNAANEQTWLLIGRVAEQMGDLEHALNAYENALRHNPVSLSGLTQVAGIARIKENYPKVCGCLLRRFRGPPFADTFASDTDRDMMSFFYFRQLNSFNASSTSKKRTAKSGVLSATAILCRMTSRKPIPPINRLSISFPTPRKIPSSGTALESSTTAMAPSTMPKKPFPQSSGWTKVGGRGFSFPHSNI